MASAVSLAFRIQASPRSKELKAVFTAIGLSASANACQIVMLPAENPIKCTSSVRDSMKLNTRLAEMSRSAKRLMGFFVRKKVKPRASFGRLNCPFRRRFGMSASTPTTLKSSLSSRPTCLLINCRCFLVCVDPCRMMSSFFLPGSCLNHCNFRGTSSSGARNWRSAFRWEASSPRSSIGRPSARSAASTPRNISTIHRTGAGGVTGPLASGLNPALHPDPGGTKLVSRAPAAEGFTFRKQARQCSAPSWNIARAGVGTANFSAHCPVVITSKSPG
mmetsp:Transcript_8364/g.18302  ORF Transcript_8364/g.18302 Transcript_8364/m.18302 type:complete len:276 (-) Transcript_8364:297-1124(-)